MLSKVQYGTYIPASRPRLASLRSALGANHRLASHRSNASTALRLSTANGSTHSGGSIASASCGLFSRCVPQYGQRSVCTLSSMRTTAPQPSHFTSLWPFSRVRLPRIRSRAASRSFSHVSVAPRSIFWAWPQYGQTSAPADGLKSRRAPHFWQGNLRPGGGALLVAGGLVCCGNSGGKGVGMVSVQGVEA